MSSATMREDAGFCPVIMHPVLTAKGDMSATARQYLAPFYKCKQSNVSHQPYGCSISTSLAS